jgi:hypothetical protein
MVTENKIALNINKKIQAVDSIDLYIKSKYGKNGKYGEKH